MCKSANREKGGEKEDDVTKIQGNFSNECVCVVAYLRCFRDLMMY